MTTYRRTPEAKNLTVGAIPVTYNLAMPEIFFEKALPEYINPARDRFATEEPETFTGLPRLSMMGGGRRAWGDTNEVDKT